MTYSETDGYSGELFVTYDNFGNTATLTDIQGNVIVGYLYDLNNGKIVSEYNPQGINNPFGFRGELGIENITLASNGKDFTILNNFGAIRGNSNLADITWAQPPGTSPILLDFCPCPEFSLGTERQFSADEIREAYESAGGGEAGVRAVLELLFGDKLNSIPKGELDAIINNLSEKGDYNIGGELKTGDWAEMLIDILDTHDSQYVNVGAYGATDLAGRDWCIFWWAASEVKYTPQEVFEMISEGIAGAETGIRGYGFRQYRRYLHFLP